MLVVSVVAQVSDQLQMVSMIVIFVNIGRNAPKQPVMIATLFLKLSIFRNDSDTEELMQKLAQLVVASPCQRLMLLSPVRVISLVMCRYLFSFFLFLFSAVPCWRVCAERVVTWT